MIRVLGEPQAPRIFWLVILLAVLLLVVVSSAPARATGANEPGPARQIDTLLALGEALRAPRAAAAAAPVHPELADGGSTWLRNVSLRQVRALKQVLATGRHDGPATDTRDLLAIEAERLHLELLAFGSAQEDGGALGRSLARLESAQVAEAHEPEG